MAQHLGANKSSWGIAAPWEEERCEELLSDFPEWEMRCCCGFLVLSD